MIKKAVLVLALSVALSSCGGSDEPFFPGTWNGTLTLENNTCPLVNPKADLNSLFPVTVVDNNDGSFTVTAANGDTGQGNIQGNILVVPAPIFGVFGLEDDNRRSSAVFQFLNTSGDEANVSDTFTITNAAIASDSDDEVSCEVVYTGTATRQ